MKKRILIIISILAVAAGACERTDIFTGDPSGALSVTKEITSFSFFLNGVVATIDHGAFTIEATLPSTTDVTALAATFITTGTSVHVGAMEQVSDTTTNNFSASVTYTVTAEDSSTQDYVVNVNLVTGTPYEILHETGSGSAWFGGDSGHATGRNLGHAQSVLVDQDILLESFAFQLTRAFSPSGSGVPVRLNVLDAGESILRSFEMTIPASFAGGWVTWSGLNMDVATGTTLVFVAYVIDGTYTNEFDNGISANMSTDSYTDGQRYMANGTFTDAQMDVLSNYDSYPTNDLFFHLQGQEY